MVYHTGSLVDLKDQGGLVEMIEVGSRRQTGFRRGKRDQTGFGADYEEKLAN